MATIRNTITLADRMTPTLRSVMRAVDATLSAMKALDAAHPGANVTKHFTTADAAVRKANNDIIMMSNYSKMAASGARDVENAWHRVNAATSKSAGSFSNIFSNIAGGIYTIRQVTRAVGGFTKMSDKATTDMAKLGTFNNTGYSNEQIYGKVYQTAQDSRADLSDTAGLAQRIAMSGVYEGPGSLLSSIDMAGTINKALTVGGGTSEENSRAVKQLSQALSSGVLQGDELRSIREQAPYLGKVLAEGLGKIDDKFIGTTIGDLKELGAQGELTSDVVIRALEAMSDEVDKSFDEHAPKTFAQALQSIGNTVQFFIGMLNSAGGPLGKFKDALWGVADFLSTPQGFEFMSSIIPILNIAAFLFQALGWAIQFVGNNISWIAPIFGTILTMLAIYNGYLAISKAITWATGIAQGIAAVAAYARAKAENKAALSAAAGTAANTAMAASLTAESMAAAGATAAQHGFNAALWACPITWIILILIVLIGLIFIIVGIVNQATGSTVSAIGIICGAFMVAVAFIWNLLLALLDFLLGLINYIVNPWIAFANFFGNLFNDPIGSIAHLFGDLADNVLGVVETIAKAIDKVFGSNLAGAVQGWRSNLNSWVDKKAEDWGNGKYEEVMSEINLSSESLGLGRFEYGSAWDMGYNFGADIENAFAGMGEFNPEDLLGGMDGTLPAEIAGGDLDSVGEVGSDVNISDEDIKLLRDMAARDYLLQLQSVTPVAHVTFGDVKETADVNKIVEVIEQMVDEQMATALVS